MFELPRFSQPPGPALAAELDAANPGTLDDDALMAYLAATNKLEAWVASRRVSGLVDLAERHQQSDPDDDPEAEDATAKRPARRPRGGPRPVQFGGSGTPWVDEFAADLLAPVLRVAPATAGAMLGDVLDLRYRLPWVLCGLRGGALSWQAARMIAAGTRRLSPAKLASARVDPRLFTSATRLTPGKLRTRIQDVVAAADPDRVDDDADGGTRRRYVGFQTQPDAQTTSIFGELDPTGAQRLDQQITTVAGWLRRLDPDTDWEALRAHALTLLADPAGLQRVHDRATGSGGDRSSPLPTTVVHVQTDPEAWSTRKGLAEVEGVGWMPLWSLTSVLADSRVRVVADTAERHADGCTTDAGYRPSQHTRDVVCARDRTCRFPGCNRRARACQLDHTRPWPHGPTCACNLGALCTRHHRLKTHTDWSLRQPWPGVFLWRSPQHQYWLVDHTGTTPLDVDVAA
ncbi:MAG: DUF222 domain-containing protein [Nocardioidaceae bacterium]